MTIEDFKAANEVLAAIMGRVQHAIDAHNLHRPSIFLVAEDIQIIWRQHADMLLAEFRTINQKRMDLVDRFTADRLSQANWEDLIDTF